jgi:RNA polymerase sigma factor (sigma-70 family)
MQSVVHAEIARDEFVRLLDTHRKILYKVAASWCRDSEDRRDLAQDIVMHLWRSYPRYDPQLPFSTWMYRVAMNVAISFHRSATRRPSGGIPIDEFLELAMPEEPREIRELRDHIETMDPMHKALLLLYLDGHDHSTIAEILGISSSNVGTRLARLKERLRRELR